MAYQRFRTPYPGTCVWCGSPVEQGAWSYWERARLGISCCRCVETPEPAPNDAEPAAARRDYELRDFEVTPEAATAPAPGSGDAAVLRILDALAADGVRLVHGRRVPELRATIDHIAVAPTGVYVIASRSAEGSISVLRRSFSRKHELHVGGRNRTEWLSGVKKPVDAVRAALDGAPVPLFPTIATRRVQWPTGKEWCTIEGVTVMSWPVLCQRLREAGTLRPENTEQIARMLLRALPALGQPHGVGRSAGAAATSV